MSKTDSMLLGNDIPFVEAAHHGGRQRPTAIVLRTSFTTGDNGAALGIANAWHNKNNRVDSCHYVVDEAKVFRCVPDRVMAFPLQSTSTLYKNTISINICHDPPVCPDEDVIYGVGHLVARLCKLHKIKVRILDRIVDANEECRWVKHKWRSRGGIILKTVGDFPVDRFLEAIELEQKLLNGG